MNWLPASDCYLCHASVTSGRAYNRLICQSCHQDLAHLTQCCEICSLPLNSMPDLTCGHCLHHTPLFNKTVAAYHYEPPVSDFITQLKFNGRRQSLAMMCQDLTSKIQFNYHQEKLPDCLIPVPLHAQKIRQRGFNQAKLIADKLAKNLTIPVDNQIATRTRKTLPQVDLDATQRVKNLAGAFTIQDSPAPYVAIVDDVMTTGTTVSELTKVLLKAGAQRVDVWCLARAFQL